MISDEFTGKETESRETEDSGHEGSEGKMKPPSFLFSVVRGHNV